MLQQGPAPIDEGDVDHGGKVEGERQVEEEYEEGKMRGREWGGGKGQNLGE